MKAIVIAAGRGTRLRPHTADRPKCMVEVAGRPLLHHQIAAFRAAGISDIVVIVGYRARAVTAPGVRLVKNRHYAEHQILMSLFSAAPELVGDVIVSYGDIIYHPNIVATLAGICTPGCLVVDEGWEATYADRTDHPIEQAELCRTAPSGMVREVGKHVGPEGAFGEFIGLARFSASLLGRLVGRYYEAVAVGPERPFGAASSLKQAYLTDLVNEGIARDEAFSMLAIDGGWRELDTVQDLERAHEAVTW